MAPPAATNRRRRDWPSDLLVDTDSEDEGRIGGNGDKNTASDSGSNGFPDGDDLLDFVPPSSTGDEESGRQKENVVQQRKITVVDKSAAKKKSGGSTAAKTAPASTKATSNAGTSEQKKKKKRPTSRSRTNKSKQAQQAGGDGKKTTTSKRTATSSTAATTTSRKRSPTRVRFEQDGEFDQGTAAGRTSSSPTTNANDIPATSTIPAIPIHPRAVGIDTRVLQTFIGDAAGRAFLGQTLSFLKSSARRGMLPQIIAVTHATSRGRGSRARTVIQAKAAHLPGDKLTGREYVRDDGDTTTCTSTSSLHQLLPPKAREEQQYWNEMLVPVQIRPLPSNAGNAADAHSVVHVPKSLLANDSWKYFAELVNAVEAQVALDRNGTGTAFGTEPPSPPRSLTIFTNDVSLFSDTNADSHKRALGRFWEKIRGSFQNGVVGSVTIAIYETGAVAMRSNAKPAAADGNDGTAHDGAQGEDENGVGDSFPINHPDDALAHRLKVKKCISTLQKEIDGLHEKDRRKNASVSGTPPLPINLELQVIENPIMYQALLRDWIRNVVSPSSGGGRISFNLPETMDGTQCSISLDLAYSILPYPVDSVETAKLLMDLKALSSAEFEVIQLLPVPSIDGSLLYSVPMSSTAAMDSDLFRYKEMKILCRQLWKFLATKDVALALRCIGAKQDEESALEADTASHAIRRVVNDLEGQCFLLMAEDPTGNFGGSTEQSLSPASGVAPLNGVLYRYASSDHLIRDETETVDTLQDEDEEETSQQYYEYIDQSLECLETSPINPLFVDTRTVVKKKEESLSADSLSDIDDATKSMETTSLYEDKWGESDGVGVGSRAITSGEEDDGMIPSDDGEDEPYHEFVYSF